MVVVAFFMVVVARPSLGRAVARMKRKRNPGLLCCVRETRIALRSIRATLALSSGGPRPDLTLDPPAKLSLGRLQLVTSLKVDPEIRRGAEITREAEGGVGGDAAAAEHDVVDPRPRHLDGLRQRIDADLHRLQEILAQDFAWMNERQSLACGDLGEVDPARIQIVALDAHRLILCDSPRSP